MRLKKGGDGRGKGGSVLHIRHNKGEGINDFRWNLTWREGVNKNLLNLFN